MNKLLAILLLLPVCVFADPVNVNQADAETIAESLEGVGPKKAEAIVQYRKEHGDFKTLQDLENVSGIGEKTLKANEKDILFSGDVSAPKVEKPVNGEKDKTPKGSK